MRCPRTNEFVKLSFKALKAKLSNLSHKIGFGLLLLSKEYRGLAVKEKVRIQFNNQLV